MTTDEVLFFHPVPEALPLYAALSEKILEAFPNTAVKVQKTQITFRARYNFAFVSLRRIRGCPEVFLIVTFGLSRRETSPRIALAVEPYPNRWTHHVIISDEGQIDAELMSWLQEAHDFAQIKGFCRRR